MSVFRTGLSMHMVGFRVSTHLRLQTKITFLVFVVETEEYRPELFRGVNVSSCSFSVNARDLPACRLAGALPFTCCCACTARVALAVVTRVRLQLR